MSLWLDPDFAKLLPSSDPFATIYAMQGEELRAREGRRTIRFSLGGKSFVAKIHSGIGWWEIFKNLIRMRMPVTGAKNEWKAIHYVNSKGVATPKLVAYGSRGLNPATKQSFIVTEDLVGSVTLETYCQNWPQNPLPPPVKRKIILMVAEIAHRIHYSGMNHRDFYLCHFRIDPNWANTPDQPLTIYLMDLHRAQKRWHTPRHWLIKDLGGLFFSAMDIGLTFRDYLRFMSFYRCADIRWVLVVDVFFWFAVRKRAMRQYQSFHKKTPVIPFSMRPRKHPLAYAVKTMLGIQ